MVSTIKTNLSYYLNQVASGEPIVIFDRDRPIATLQRYIPTAKSLTSLVRRGIIQQGSASIPGELIHPPVDDGCEINLTDILSAERNESY